jgi:hypothetical protein
VIFVAQTGSSLPTPAAHVKQEWPLLSKGENKGSQSAPSSLLRREGAQRDSDGKRGD